MFSGISVAEVDDVAVDRAGGEEAKEAVVKSPPVGDEAAAAAADTMVGGFEAMLVVAARMVEFSSCSLYAGVVVARELLSAATDNPPSTSLSRAKRTEDFFDVSCCGCCGVALRSSAAADVMAEGREGCGDVEDVAICGTTADVGEDLGEAVLAGNGGEEVSDKNSKKKRKSVKERER